jgi:DNA repair ATPase RecN
MAQEAQPDPRQDPRQQDQQAPHQADDQRAELSAPNVEAVNDSVRAAIQRMWDVVRKGADIIVTLRQENTILQNQIGSLKHSEEVLQTRVEDFLGRIAELERQSDDFTDSDPGTSTDRLEDRVGELEALLHDAQQQLDQTTAQLQQREAELSHVQERLEENAEISQQLSQVRNELEARTQLLQELQEQFDGREITIDDNDEERDRLQAELDRSLKIIEKYRSAGLRHLEEEGTEDQIALFGDSSRFQVPGSKFVEQGMLNMEPGTRNQEPGTDSDLELRALADRLEGVAKRLDDLFGLS